MLCSVAQRFVAGAAAGAWAGGSAPKFGERVAEILKQVVEPRYDARGKVRSWEACKLDFLAGLALADQRALEVATAQEIHLCGSLLTDVRRLGVEYLSGYAPGRGPRGGSWSEKWLTPSNATPAAHARGMLAELRHLTSRWPTRSSPNSQTGWSCLQCLPIAIFFNRMESPTALPALASLPSAFRGCLPPRAFR